MKKKTEKTPQNNKQLTTKKATNHKLLQSSNPLLCSVQLRINSSVNFNSREQIDSKSRVSLPAFITEIGEFAGSQGPAFAPPNRRQGGARHVHAVL